MRPAIRQAWITSRGNLTLPSPNGVVPIGFNTEHQFVIDERPIKDHRERDLPDKTNFMFKGTSKQITLTDLNWFIHAWSAGVAAEITSEKEGVTYGAGSYRFDGDEFMGLDFEYREKHDERSCDITLEVELENEVAKQIIQSAGVNTPRDLNALGEGHRGQQTAKYRTPHIGFFESPFATTLCNNEEIISKEFIIKNVATKRYRNRTKTTWINFRLALVLDKAANWDLLTLLNKNRTASLRIVEKNSLTSSQVYNFNEGVLFRKHKIEIDKSKREVEVLLEGNVAIPDIVFSGSPVNTITVSENI